MALETLDFGRNNRGAPRQQAARKRNWRIYQLRSLQMTLFSNRMINPRRRRDLVRILDQELIELGAKTFNQHQGRDDD